MKRCSFKVARALKEAGYPQYGSCDEYYNQEGHVVSKFCDINKLIYPAPTYLEVWIWLWKVKKIKLMPTPIFNEIYNDINKVGIVAPSCYIEANDPEEAIEKAVDYLVDNNLIN